MMKSYQELDTEGWYLKVGDVYSSPFQYTHFKVTKIELEEGAEICDAFVYGERVHPEDYTKTVLDADEEKRFRVWYLNDNFALETP